MRKLFFFLILILCAVCARAQSPDDLNGCKDSGVCLFIDDRQEFITITDDQGRPIGDDPCGIYSIVAIRFFSEEEATIHTTTFSITITAKMAVFHQPPFKK